MPGTRTVQCERALIWVIDRLGTDARTARVVAEFDHPADITLRALRRLTTKSWARYVPAAAGAGYWRLTETGEAERLRRLEHMTETGVEWPSATNG